MKKKIIVSAVLLAISIYAINLFFIQPKSVEKQMKSVAQNLNKKCPIYLEKNSRLDSVSTISNTNFIYYKTLYAMDKRYMKIDSSSAIIRPHLLKEIKENPNYEAFKKHNISIDYVFYDKHGSFVNKISFTPELYAH
ncbi:hypothetical protein CLV91_0555 [Maribacter vaceletii]|uniref:Uncharacterized protein n=1 Tax=Maribacter vaceletii TaxID=1206816 RepID=A0A495EC65_9FLAO|nr:hypothetical protein [Maribacter vaceletii]RKR14478.1 hypothetical protein CLV91_0555 [Maribacter vaceletii]